MMDDWGRLGDGRKDGVKTSSLMDEGVDILEGGCGARVREGRFAIEEEEVLALL